MSKITACWHKDINDRWSNDYNRTYDLKGAILLAAWIQGDEMYIIATNGLWRFYHDQDCCECVGITTHNLHNPEPGVIKLAEERTETPEPNDDYTSDDYFESRTYTFYTIRTDKDDIDICWQGDSNGYYSESVDIAVGPIPKEWLNKLSDNALVALDNWQQQGGVLPVE